MLNILTVFHVLFCLCLVALVLMQHGKGAGTGLGGGSDSVFGSVGHLPFVAKLTAVFAALFFATTLLIGYHTSHAVSSVSEQDVSTSLLQAAPEKSENPQK